MGENFTTVREASGAPPGDAAIGCLMGMAVGDALGLPLERLSRGRQQRMFPVLRHRFVGRWGFVSDDTEHACMIAQAVIVSGGDPERFVRSLAWRLRWWMLGLPAGAGLATLRAGAKLWCGASWKTSGVFSAGNGPAMRSPILGALFAHRPEVCRELVRRSTLLTHTDPKALAGAQTIAIAARESVLCRGVVNPKRFLAILQNELGDGGEELLALTGQAVESAERGEATPVFSASLGLAQGVSGYILHTVPVVLHAWFAFPGDYEKAVASVIQCGGDTDTTAAILGGIVGAGLGRGEIPEKWVHGVAEWPCGIDWLERLGARSAEVVERGTAGVSLAFNIPGQCLRNLFFMMVVLFHGFRRMLPPF